MYINSVIIHKETNNNNNNNNSNNNDDDDDDDTLIYIALISRAQWRFTIFVLKNKN